MQAPIKRNAVLPVVLNSLLLPVLLHYSLLRFPMNNYWQLLVMWEHTTWNQYGSAQRAVHIGTAGIAMNVSCISTTCNGQIQCTLAIASPLEIMTIPIVSFLFTSVAAVEVEEMALGAKLATTSAF